ncbi:histidine kinase [Thermocrinis albus DSM 14484]|uniref:histidine kinase n=1 Tax=Thermocrinis albus (strain DSM 14484 / JCM 11386 / HI 11/12) TaxID=638303 RepID=D3SP35_THEAH|nr:ATP-binding protein [Thermocrinis albus]ADC88922.1 histidine kinase [Thermocrinis albus DSM 14484]
MKDILHLLDEGVLLLDREGRILLINRWWISKNLAREDWEGKYYYEALRSLSVISAIGQLLEGGESLYVMHEDAKYLIKKKIMEGDKRLFLVSDVSSLWQYEKLKRDLVENVAHELKTPLSAVTLLLERAAKECPSSFAIHRALHRLQQMEKLIDDMLILARLESGVERLHLTEIHLREFLQDVYYQLREEFEKAKVNFENLVDESFVLVADENKLYLILRNLLENAVRYNREGGSVRVRGWKEGQMAVVEVSDTGIGIPKEHIPFIFDRFYRVDKGRSRDRGGTGLGLSIVRNAVRLHGGSIELQSEVGKGSTFRIYIPQSI